MKKYTIIFILLLALLTSGCITMRIETKIKKDDSGTKSFVVALDKSVMDMVEGMSQESGAEMEDIWATARTGAETIEGAKVEDYSDEDSEGIKVTVPFDNLQELAALSQSDAFEGTDTVTVRQEGNARILTAVVSTGDLTSGLDQASAEELEGFDLGNIDLEYSYTVDVEGDILDYSPQGIAEVKGSQVTWDLSRAGGATTELMVKWEPGGGPDMLFILLIVIAVGGLALAAVGVILVLRGRSSVTGVELE